MRKVCRLWCGGLPSDISEPELYEEFSKHGKVVSISIRSSPHDTFAFVEMDEVGAEMAIARMSRAPLWGSPHLNVRMANDNQSHAGPPCGSNAGSPADTGALLRPREPQDWDPFGLWANMVPECRSEQVVRRPGRRKLPPDGARNSDGVLALRVSGRQDSRERSCHQRSVRLSESSLALRSDGPSRPGDYTPPPPPGSGEHALYESTAIEWRARHLSITVENIPPDMAWLELKNLGRMYGFVAHARTFRENGVCCGALEFSRQDVLEKACEALEGQIIEGSRRPLKVRVGTPPTALLPKSSSSVRRPRH